LGSNTGATAALGTTAAALFGAGGASMTASLLTIV